MMGWKISSLWRQEPQAPEAGWILNGQGFDHSDDARREAGVLLRSLEGKNHGRLILKSGSARFEAAGSVDVGFVCHRTPDSRNPNAWLVLTGAHHDPDATMDVPMGRGTGHMPLRLIHPYSSAESALWDFIREPAQEELAPEWVSGGLAEGTRLESP